MSQGTWLWRLAFKFDETTVTTLISSKLERSSDGCPRSLEGKLRVHSSPKYFYHWTMQVVNKAGQSWSLANLTVTEGFEKNHSGSRVFRIDIDASIWFNTVCIAKEARTRNSAFCSSVCAHWHEYPFYRSLFFMTMSGPRWSEAAKYKNLDSIALHMRWRHCWIYLAWNGEWWRTYYSDKLDCWNFSGPCEAEAEQLISLLL
jgi:hypothetical protein